MASEGSDDGAVTVDLPPEVEEWLDGQADRRGEDRGTVLEELLAVHTAVGDAADLDGSDATPADGRFDDLEERTEELIEDVRERVVQVKREADAKAPADHDHPEVADRAAAAADGVERLESTVADLRERVDEAEQRVDAGFENYEDVLEYLTETVDGVEEDLDTLARAVVEVRTEVERLSAAEAAREDLADLKLAASQSGVRTGECAACEATVDVRLLTTAECPHCASPFVDVRAKTGFFGSHELVTGDRPALEGRTEGDLDAPLSDLVADDETVADGGDAGSDP